MRKICILLIVFVHITAISFGQYVWNGINGTDYQDAANWTPNRIVNAPTDVLQFNAITPIIVTNVKTEVIGSIQILSGTNSVTFSTNINAITPVLTLSAATPLIYSSAGSILSADNLTIKLNNLTPFSINSGILGIALSTGGKIAINGPLVLNGGTLDFDIAGSGGVIINAGGSITNTSGIFNCVTPSSITWAAGSNYYHNVTGAIASAIPAAIWQTGSNCNITGLSAAIPQTPTGLTSIDFADFTWNCSTQTSNVDLLPASAVLNIIGTFSINSTNNKELRLSSAGTVKVNAGNYLQTGGSVTLRAGTVATDTTNLNVSGSFSHTGGGVLNGVGASSPGVAIINFKGNVIRGAGTTWQSNSSNNTSQFILQFSASTTQAVDVSGGTFILPTNSRCSIVNNNTDLVNGINLTGILRVANPTNALADATCTMNGKISGAGSVSYTSGAGTAGTTLIYSGSTFQTATVAEFPVANGPLNLTINNILGLGFPVGFARTVSGKLSMINGKLEMGANSLTLDNSNLANQLSYSGGFITSGTLGRFFPTSALPTDTSDTRSLFPFGSGYNNRFFRIYFSSASLSAGTPGIISVTHNSINGVVSLPGILDNGITLDKRSSTNWTTNMGAFNLGAGGEKISVTVDAGNIGSVDDYTKLRLTDGVTSFGTGMSPVTNAGDNSLPVTGKSGLIMADMNKPLYIGSDGTNVYNPLVVITFNWTGNGGNAAWTNPGNWSVVGASGYPSASTEIAIITSKVIGGSEPTINTIDNISVNQLTVGGGMTLTMTGNAILNVYDVTDFTGGAASLATTSTFGYASSNAAQTILSLPYGNLSVSGTATKNLPAAITVKGNYSISGSTPIFTSNVFTYAGSGAQKITATNYDNLTITGNRGGNLITLGNGSSNNIIDIKNVFDVSSLTNFISKADFNTVNFSSAGPQNIPGFYYQTITNSDGDRTFDNLGSTNPNHVITCFTMSRGAGTYTIANSKVKFYSLGLNSGPYNGSSYYDLEMSGDFKGYPLDFFNGTSVSIAGTFSITATNFKLATSGNIYRFNFNGTQDQTIPAFKFIDANTPGFKYSNVFITGGNRNVTMGGGGVDTIAIRGKLTPETIAPNISSPFNAGKGFITTGSTIDFSSASNDIPLLKPLVVGNSNYNNIVVSSGSRAIGANNMIIGGNVTVSGNDAAPATLTVGDGNNARNLTVLGNITINGIGTGIPVNSPSQIDLNTGTNGTTKINLSGNLTIVNSGQIMGTTSDNAKNGQVVFNGSTIQLYSNTDLGYKNGLVNFVVGDGINPSNLTMASSMNLLTSSATSPNRDTLTISKNSSVDFGTFNLSGNGAGSAAFNLNADATLITANTGGIEGLATNGSTGSIVNDATILKTYDPLASYVFNAVSNTNTNFSLSVTPFPMANLTIGNDINSAIFSLNKSISITNTLNLKKSATIAVGENYVNLRSTASSTARLAPVPSTANITYGSSGRFVIERFYPARRAWRLITAPITADPGRSVFSSWQLANAPFGASGYGTFITGNSANPLTNGLDVSPLNNSSLKTYDGVNFADVTNTKSLLLSGTLGNPGIPDNTGFLFFVRGDRNPAANLFNISNVNTTTLQDTGKVQIKDQTFTINGAADSYQLVGNPYASPVDIATIMASTPNIYSNVFYTWDPYINSVGGYITMFLSGGGWLAIPNRPGGQDTKIQSGQAFFVRKSIGSPANLAFHESDKSTQNNLGVFRQASLSSQLRTNLYLRQTDSLILADGNMVIFDNSFSETVNKDDIIKFSNINETIGLLRYQKMLALEARPDIVDSDTIFFKLTKTTQRNYRLEFVPQNLNPILVAFLEDGYTGLKTPISLNVTNYFDFIVNGDAKSAASDRFKIVFKAAVGLLPVTYKSIKAYQQKDNIAVEWTVENETNVSKYDVEKSTDGIKFIKINTTIAKGIDGISSYTFLDKNALKGNNFYRIHIYNQNGDVGYTKVVLVKIDEVKQDITVYPNPVTGNTISLVLNNLPEGKYDVKLLNALGQTLIAKKLNHIIGNSIETIILDNAPVTGIYQLMVTLPDSTVDIIKVFVQ